MLEGHPLRKLFADLTRETFYRELHHYDSEVAAYLVDLLVGLRTSRTFTKSATRQGGAWKTWEKC